jgi:hypothetical protein
MAAPAGNLGVINQNNGESKLSILPNPNKGSFTLAGTLANTGGASELSFEVVDMLGQVVYKDAATIENGGISKSITLGDNIANGIYLIRVKGEGEKRAIRFTLDR